MIRGPRLFQCRRVLVVGAGLGLAGLVCASCTKAQEAGPVATGRATKRDRGKGQIHGRNGGFLWILHGF